MAVISFRKGMLAAALAVPMGLLIAGGAIAQEITFLLRNETTANLLQFYASPVTSDSWEDDLLAEEEPLVVGETLNVVIPDDGRGCMYDIKGIFADGDEVEEFGVDICDLGTYTYTEAGE
ncbi:MAG: hypothetical protein AAFY78_16195 [Cyanobacteria bacterium J06648_16]